MALVKIEIGPSVPKKTRDIIPRLLGNIGRNRRTIPPKITAGNKVIWCGYKTVVPVVTILESMGIEFNVPQLYAWIIRSPQGNTIPSENYTAVRVGPIFRGETRRPPLIDIDPRFFGLDDVVPPGEFHDITGDSLQESTETGDKEELSYGVRKAMDRYYDRILYVGPMRGLVLHDALETISTGLNELGSLEPSLYPCHLVLFRRNVGFNGRAIGNSATLEELRMCDPPPLKASLKPLDSIRPRLAESTWRYIHTVETEEASLITPDEAEMFLVDQIIQTACETDIMGRFQLLALGE